MRRRANWSWSARVTIHINASRLHERLRELARVGATDGGGVTRLALTDEDRAGRDLLVSWLRAAGLAVRVDDFGNIVGRREGTIGDGNPVLIGSHIDTVRRGGRYDGALGVLGALEVIETLNDGGIANQRPIEVVNWTNEEGVRFEPAMTCSGAVFGRFERDYVYDRRDRDGLRFEDELRRIGYLGDASNRPATAAAYLELHIEQGPVLEAAGVPVGVVEGIVGITWSEVTWTGQADHAGPSPMRLRRDALGAAARLVTAVEAIALRDEDPAVATVGRIVAEPNVINTIPGKVVMSVDFRNLDGAKLDAMIADLETAVRDISAHTGVDGHVHRFWTSEPTPFAPEIVAEIEQACASLGLPILRLWSGAGHDAKYVADGTAAGMIFVRSQGGLSHCEAEFSDPADIEAGANVLLNATCALAGIEGPA